MTLVDYHPIAVRPYLQDNDGRFVGDAAAAALLRPEPIPLFRTALRRIALSRDTARRFETLAPGYPVICADHWSRRALETRDVLVPRIWGGEALRVLVFGPLDRHKGRALVLDAARLAAERGSPLSFHVLGASKSVAPLPRLPALKEHGPFTARSLPGQLGAIAPHVVWFPAQVPETWCYALSDAMEALLPVVAPIIGAFPERCLGRPATWLLPFDSDADRAVRLFTDLHATGLALPPAWSAVAGPAPQTFYPDAYLAAAARGPTGRRPNEA
jgi:glycosyltransferase involved in cell wall biosynthesis